MSIFQGPGLQVETGMPDVLKVIRSLTLNIAE